jgi:CubicO group peptidase (beta-lactamase class C family)
LVSADEEFLQGLLADPEIGVADPDGPGAVVGLVAGGELRAVAARGLANIEHAVPIRRATIFHVASVSKQFTAYAVAMLAAEGALALDDPVVAHLGWFPFGDITVRQLIHHVSGLRDQWALTILSGRRIEDVITTEDVLTLVAGQRELNFPPGSQYSYSNTGYTLLGSIVEAVTGARLREFCAERIFGPLGMEHTTFLDDHHEVISRRADSYYRRAGGGYGRIALSYSIAGATSLNTTVDDLVRWSRHVMTPPVRALLQERYTLTDGTELDYATGVTAGEHRGLRSLSHAGSDAGYRSFLLVLPEERSAAIVLANLADLNVRRLAHAAIDRLLPARDGDGGGDGDGGVGPAAATDADDLVGRYVDAADVIYEVRPDDGRYTLRFGWTALPLHPGAAGRLVDDVLGFHIEAAGDGILIHPDHGASPHHGHRLDARAADNAGADYAGTYYSRELDVVLHIDATSAGTLRLRRIGWATTDLQPLAPGLFLAVVPLPEGRAELLLAVRFGPGRSELRLGHPQARRIGFARLD